MKKAIIAIALVAVAYGALAYKAGSSGVSTIAHAAEVQDRQMQQIDELSK